MRKSPLLLKNYFLTNLQISANPHYEPQKPYQYLFNNITCNVKHLTNKKLPNVWQVQLNLSYSPGKEENIPYRFSINLVGFFELHRKESNSTTDILVAIGAPSILYSTAREILASITGRGPWNAILLPMADFMPKIRKTKKRKRIKK